MRRWQHAVTPCRIAAFLASCGLLACTATEATGQEQVSYEVSASPAEQILFYTMEGGFGVLAPQYRLFGDGRLVREILSVGAGRPVLLVHETQIGTQDIELLFQLIVSSGLVDLTPERLREAAGGTVPGLIDGRTHVVEPHFTMYKRPGEAALVPYSTRVRMPTPASVLQQLPELAGASAFVELLDALDGSFPKPASAVINERYTGTQQERED